jgi:Domain of unknown function (DUF5916)
MLRNLTWVALWLPSIALGAPIARGAPVSVQAERTVGPIRLDGRVDEEAWRRAPPFSGFAQSFPDFGAAPTEGTTVRVLYDHQFLYVAFVCQAPRGEIVRRLGRRDTPGEADRVSVAIDSAHDHRTAYKFQISVAGVKKDSLHYEDYRSTSSWDEVWDAVASDIPEGWSAEFAIPLRILPFSGAPDQTWGIFFSRYIASRKETDSSVPIPANANAEVSLYGHLTGLVDLKLPLRLELIPFVAARAVRRPQFSAPFSTQPLLTLPSGDVGGDFKVRLSRGVTLNGTLNPDFGQVEADTIQLNLTNSEIFYPEKRPFFMQGMSIFQSLGSDDDDPSPQNLFYSRRIGLTSPIFGAVKLSGNPIQGVEIGVLDAVVAGAANPTLDERQPDLTATWSSVQPLHLGPNAALPNQAPIPQNYFTAVARAQVLPRLTVGPTVGAATPLVRPCTAAEAALPDEQQPQRCSAIGANVAGFDWTLSTDDGFWGIWGQMAGSQAVGGEPRTLRDGTEIRPGTTGHGFYFTAGKLGGEPFRLTLTGEYESPTLDLNPTGYQKTQNQKLLEAQLAYVRSRQGPFRNLKLRLTGTARSTSDGREISRGNKLSLKGEAYLPGYHTGSFSLAYDDHGFDVREIRRTGIPFQEQKEWQAGVEFKSDERKPVHAGLRAEVLHSLAQEPLPSTNIVRLSGSLALVPAPWLHTDFAVAVDRSPQAARWTGTAGTDLYFAGLRAGSSSVTVRQLVAFTPDLTFQLYSQLFTGYGIYGPFYQASASSLTPIHIQDLQPTPTRSGQDFRITTWNVNAVLRWEYRLGSALYLAYTRAQSALPVIPGTPVQPRLLDLDALGQARTEEVLLLKWSYWWGA